MCLFQTATSRDPKCNFYNHGEVQPLICVAPKMRLPCTRPSFQGCFQAPSILVTIYIQATCLAWNPCLPFPPDSSQKGLGSELAFKQLHDPSEAPQSFGASGSSSENIKNSSHLQGLLTVQ